MFNQNKKLNNINYCSGFTLIESVVTIVIFATLMLGVTKILTVILTTSKQDLSSAGNIDQVKRISNNFTNEIRNSANGANGAYAVNKADDTQLIFYSTGIKKDGSISQVRYYTSGNTLYKGVKPSAGNPPTYDTYETITPLLTTLASGSSPLFYYYDGNYQGTGNSLTQPVNINNVSFIKMNLVVLKNDDKNNTVSTFAVSSGGSLRNLKTNLGN